MEEKPETGEAPRRRLSDRNQTSAAAHVPRLVRSREVHADVHGSSRLGQLNSRIAVLITKSVGTMWAAYVFALLALISFPNAMMAFLHGDTVTGISWISQAFLQLVLLPIILVGQNVISASQDARAEADHETLTALHTMNVRQLQMLEQQEKILEILRHRAGGERSAG
jgi:hypothetical protein